MIWEEYCAEVQRQRALLCRATTRKDRYETWL